MIKIEINNCNECGSDYFKHSSQMMALCPECSHYLYGYENCTHTFEENRCIHCYWDASTTEFIQKLKGK